MGRAWRVRGRELPLGRTLVMGILNLTPDSFSDGGELRTPEAALERAKALVDQGADLLDVGAESTRPGATPVPVEEELRRLDAVLPRLLAEVPVPVSVDTQKAAVARYAIEAGAHVINDVWGLQGDPGMADSVAAADVGLVLMHNSRTTHYPRGLMVEVQDFLAQSVRRAEQAGIERSRLVLDPGIGFGKEPPQSFEVTARLGELGALGLPILVGPSRKRFLGWATGRPVHERVYATAAVVTASVLAGADIVRVHDVAAAVDAVRVAEAVRAAGRAAAEETVGVRGLLFEACHGAYPEEREEKQPFVVDIEVGFCVGAGEDALEPSRDYTQLARAAAAVLQGPQRNLLETLAQEVVAEVRRRLPAVRRVRVEIQKPRARLGVPGQGSFVRAEWRG